MPIRILILLLAALAALAQERFSIAHAGKIVRVSDAQISPDGRQVAAVVSRANYADNRYDAELALIDAGSHRLRAVVKERRRLSAPRWSPDGKQLAFLADADGKTQVFLMPLDGGEASRLTRAPEGVQQFTWSPDGSKIAYVSQDEAPQRQGEERHNRVFEVGNNDFLIQTDQLPSHLYVISTRDGSKARKLTSGTWTLPKSLPPSSPSSPPAWSPDGKTIAIVKVATPYTGDSDQATVQLVDVESGAMRPLTGRAKNESQPQFSPDGKWVSYWAPRDGESKNVNEIFVSPAGGGEGRNLTHAIDRNIMRAIWLPDGGSLMVSGNDHTTTGVWIQPAGGGVAKRLDLGKAVPAAAFWLDASVSSKGQIAFVGAEALRPAEVYLLASADSKPERITNLNDATSALALGKTESVEWQGADSYKQDGVLTYPPDFNSSRKWPLVLYIHGGPRSASKESFSARSQLMAAQGWVVFEPNYRGSDNLGNAFQAAIWNDAGAGPGRDVMSGMELLKKRGWVDESRIAVSGWSYGGYMTTWLIGNYPSVWKCAIAGAAVTDLLDQYNLGDSNVRRGSAWGGSPWTDANRMKAAQAQSPITYASKMKTPTLILSLTGDYRVTVTQSYKLYHALRDNGVPTQFFAYPLTGHSPTDPVHSRDVDRRWLEWLKRYLEPGATTGGGQ